MEDRDFIVKATSDIFVKYLFGRESETSNDLLVSFINAVLEDSHFPRIRKIIQKNPFNYQEFLGDKSPVLDIKVEDENSRLFNVEVQSSGDYEFCHRSLYYWAKLYVSKMETGNEYSNLQPAVGINILDFVMFDKLPNFHNCFVIKDMEENRIMTDHLTLHFLELPKIPERAGSGEIVNWLLYFNSEGRDKKVMDTLIKNDDDIKKAHDEYEKFNRNQQLRWLAIDREKAYRDKLYHEKIAREKGHAEGHAEGLAEGLAESSLKKEQEILIFQLESKFGINNRAKEMIESQTDITILDQALKLILTTEKAEDILSLISKS